jgi:hypothetical protein
MTDETYKADRAGKRLGVSFGSVVFIVGVEQREGSVGLAGNAGMLMRNDG